MKLVDEFRVVDSDADHAKALAFNMLFVVWRHRTLGPAYRRIIQVATDLVSRYPDGIGVSQVLEVDVSPPEDDARKAFVDVMQVRGIKHFAVMHDGVGFKAASIRGIMSGVHALARPKFKLAVHASVAKAAAWHASQQAELGRTENEAQIATVINELRRIHRARYPSTIPPR